MKTAVIYGSTTENTKNVAKKIAEKLNASLYDVSRLKIEEMESYDFLILGTSTWGIGDLQDDWDAFLPDLRQADLSGKQIALFGLGDVSSYPDSFVDGLGILYEAIKEKDCQIRHKKYGGGDTNEFVHLWFYVIISYLL